MNRSSSRFCPAFWVFGCALTLMVLTHGAAGASPFETYGLGGRPIAMGGAVSAIAEDYTATHYNPAGLAFADRPMIAAGFVYGTPNLRLTGNPNFDYAGEKPLNGENQEIDDIRSFQVGGTFPLTRRRLKFLKVGVAANIPTSSLIRAVSVDAKKPHFVFFVAHPHRLEIKACLAMKIFSKLSVGAGVEVLIDLDFPLKLQFFNINETFLVGDVSAPPRFGPLAGLKFKPIDSLSLAAVYRGEMQNAIQMDLRLTTGGQQFIPTVDFNLISFYKPQEVVLGVSYSYKEKLLVGLDVAWMDYSKVKTHMPTYEFDVPEWVRVLLSMVNAPPPDFHDIFVPRVGVEYAINEHIAVRSGYFYKPSPVPDQTGSNNYADSNRHGVSAGVGLSFHDPWGLLRKPIMIDAVFQAQILEQRHVVKADPNNPTGNYSIDGEIFLGGIFLRHVY